MAYEKLDEDGSGLRVCNAFKNTGISNAVATSILVNYAKSNAEDETVYPNPAGSYVTFAFKAASDDVGLNLYIYSATGIQMYQSKLDPVIGQQIVMVNNWTNGIYGYSIRGASDKIGSGTFVISH